ncbi:thioredoxin domain-containing protein [Prosthecomicrobium sp. N25]|uniref:thioredoxin domain-containing protein n=1 Tax=Prosthecomicrobium sp. N25 TaxID=3129254 RepID=UPI003077A5A6
MPLAPRNLLDQAQSPYLRQHAGNPVHWRPWGPEALAEARETGRPILLSVGYAACHWCHVMAHESFEDPAVADVMNRLFVNIKVDREERPDVDQIYMAALHALGQQGGWPLTMFLTPDGGPVWGGTYFPKEARYGRPGFIQVMQEVARVFREEPDRVEANRTALTAAIEARARSGVALHRGLLDEAGARLLGLMDPVTGGTRGAPKFPQAALLDLLWRAGHRTGDSKPIDQVLLTLRQLCQGGIYDHLGGGFARYAVDDRWLVPHFEKMLYDNAQLVDLLTVAWCRTGDPLFRIRIEETVGWLEREMLTPEGAFASSLDADSEGEEGRFYVWTEAEIDAVLGPEAPLFKAVYDVTPAGNWEGKVILNRLGALERRGAEEEARLAAAHELLLRRRADRIRPGLDDKVLADWNGLAIAALARAAAVLDRPDWLDLAKRCYAFVTGTMTRQDRLGHSWRGGQLIFPGLSSDHAALTSASLALFAATTEPAYLTDAVGFAEALHAHHWDDRTGGYFLTADDAEALITRPKSPLDEATPNPNGLMAECLVRLWILTGEDRYRERADRLLTAFSGDILANVYGTASLLNALDTRLEPIEAVLIAPEATDPRALLRVIAGAADRRVVALPLRSTAGLPADHPAQGREALEGRATVYVCRANACSLPTTDPDRLQALLSAVPVVAPDRAASPG